MNERIRELAEQAGAEYSDFHSVSLLDKEIEVFAELIVKETMRVVVNNVAWNSYLNAAEAVIEHFGVE
jgi:hypothetical protein